jgi:hypothetical protein
MHFEIKDFVGLAALFLSLFNLYWQHLRRAKLFSWVNQITYMRQPLARYQALAHEMAVDELLASTGAMPQPLTNLLREFPHIQQAVASGDRSKIRGAVALNHLSHVGYVPSVDMIDTYWKRGAFTVPFMVTVSVTNLGGRGAHVRDLLLLFQSKTVPKQRWIYAAYMHVNVPDAFDSSKDLTDMQRLKGPFTGVSVGPGQTASLTLQFIPRSASSLEVGSYVVAIIGYSAKDRRKIVVTSKPFSYSFSPESYRTAFNGTEWSYFVEMEDDVADSHKINLT